MRGSELLMVAGMVIAFACVFYALATIWTECRDAGHSWLYCARLVTR